MSSNDTQSNTENLLSIASIQAEIKGMAENVNHMRQAIDNMSSELRRITVLEERHNFQNQAITRVETTVASLTTTNSDAHTKYDRAINYVAGIATAISIVWTVYGVHLQNTMTDMSDILSNARVYMAEKRITAEDVRGIVNQELQSRKVK